MSNLVQCYNKGCGQRFDPQNNKEDDCRHHPGEPFFHDAYKGWSCCQRKCTDFTEFLNMKGCVLSQHSNIKPIEPERPNSVPSIPDKLVEIKPIPAPLERPPFDTPMTILTPEIAPSLKQQLSKVIAGQTETTNPQNEIPKGTHCANGGCSVTYEGAKADYSHCLYHPGTPIFHEGLKFWSCCQRKTTDFNTFLSQEGCKEGTHVWKIDSSNDTTKVDCRWDYHQTGPYMTVTIYAKAYCPNESVIKINPIRLYANLIFPNQNNSNFELDVELREIVDVSKCVVTMYGTKVEIQLRKVVNVNWAKLEANVKKPPVIQKKELDESEKNLITKVDAVDLTNI